MSEERAPMKTEELLDDPTVVRWMHSAGFDTDPERERVARVDLLRQFLEFAGRTPTELVETCLRPDEDGGAGGREISIKGRRQTNEQINEFADQLPGSAFMRTLGGNTIRSFLIHNGILIQGPPAL